MPTGVRRCKVCGCEYTYCKTKRSSGVFRYQDVACSPEHGSIYLAQIEASRTGKQIAVSDAEIVEVRIGNFEDLIEGDDDELFEEDFDDDDAEETAIEK